MRPKIQPAAQIVSRKNKQPDWPVVKGPWKVHTNYRARGTKLINFVTTIERPGSATFDIGWDICGCGYHFMSCGHKSLTPPRWFEHLKPGGIGSDLDRPYIGLHHNRDGSPAPIVISPPRIKPSVITVKRPRIVVPTPEPARVIVQRRRPK